MRSSPSFLVVNRKGLGIHLTWERFGPSNEVPVTTPIIWGQEIDTGPQNHEKPPKAWGRNRKVTISAAFGALQIMVLLGKDLYDFIVGLFD